MEDCGNVHITAATAILAGAKHRKSLCCAELTDEKEKTEALCAGCLRSLKGKKILKKRKYEKTFGSFSESLFLYKDVNQLCFCEIDLKICSCFLIQCTIKTFILSVCQRHSLSRFFENSYLLFYN